jgi:hypothetical protein
MMDVYINNSPAFEISNMTSAVSGSGNEVQLFISPYVDGKVTKVEFTKAGRRNHQGGSTFSMSIDGMKYNGTDDALTGVGASGENTSFTFISTDAAGIAGNLTMKLGVDAQFFINESGGCQLVITYIPSVEPTHSHDFTFNAVGNTLTATCGHSDGLDCSLADANYQATLTLTPPTESFYRPGTYYSASHNLPAFNTQTGLNGTTDGIRYTTDVLIHLAAHTNKLGIKRLLQFLGIKNRRSHIILFCCSQFLNLIYACHTKSSTQNLIHLYISFISRLLCKTVFKDFLNLFDNCIFHITSGLFILYT